MKRKQSFSSADNFGNISSVLFTSFKYSAASFLVGVLSIFLFTFVFLNVSQGERFYKPFIYVVYFIISFIGTFLLSARIKRMLFACAFFTASFIMLFLLLLSLIAGFDSSGILNAVIIIFPSAFVGAFCGINKKKKTKYHRKAA